MRRNIFGLITALITFVVGIALSLVWATHCVRPNETSAIPTKAFSLTPDESTLLKGEAYRTGDTELVSSKIDEKNTRLGYKLNINYPQIKSPKTQRENSFNLYVLKVISDEIKGFKEYCLKNKTYPDGTQRREDYTLEANYEVLYATSQFLSINFTLWSYTGYLNAYYYPIALNYDLKAGKPLALNDLFKPNSKFLESIASYTVNELERLGLECGGVGGGKITDEQWFREGTLPKAENYAGWNLTRDGLQITFAKYQIGPGCLGLIALVVPYDHLKELLRNESLLSNQKMSFINILK